MKESHTKQVWETRAKEIMQNIDEGTLTLEEKSI
jgi:hypothetical protein